MLRSGFIILALLFIPVPTLRAIEFSDKEKAVIYTNAVKVLDDYQTLINQMGVYVVNDIDKAKSSSESLLELFVNRQVMIYNDLDPAHKLSEFYEAETYLANIILWYSNGLSIQLDLEKAKVSNIMAHEENVYSIDILVERNIYGTYLKQTQNKNTEELIFRIAFGLENKSLTNFRIVGIRSALSNYIIDFSKALKEVNSEEFNPEDLEKIHVSVKNMINDYTNFLSLLGDTLEQESDKEFYRTSFLKLFPDNDIKVFNDIDPDPPTSLVSVIDYLSGFITAYPNGINHLSINPDSLKFGKVMKAVEGNYYTYIDAKKYFSGNFNGRDEFRKMFALIFKISFNASGNTYTNFKINSIDISSVNFYEATTENTVEQKPELVIRPVTRKGLVVSIIGSFGQTQINSEDISALSLAKNFHFWSVSPLYGYLASIGVSYYFNDNLAVRIGGEFNTYSTKFNLKGKFTTDALTPDINGSSFNKIIEASYDSTLTINYLTLPVFLNFTSGKPGKFGFYIEAGCKISKPVSASFSTAGSYRTSGFYPSNPEVIQYLALPELGFYSKENFSEKGKFDMKGYILAFYSSIGVNIPLGYYTFVNIGPEAYIGFSDILGNKKKYYDIFGKSYTHQPTKINTFGIRISLAYKL